MGSLGGHSAQRDLTSATRRAPAGTGGVFRVMCGRKLVAVAFRERVLD
jgi:hypothetical protein